MPSTVARLLKLQQALGILHYFTNGAFCRNYVFPRWTQFK